MSEHVLVIGGSSPLALESIDAFLSRGDRVSSINRNPDIFNCGNRLELYPFVFDITNISEIHNVFNQIVSSKGPIDRICFYQRYRSEATDQWQGEFDVGLLATAKFIDAFRGQPKKNSDRSVVIVSSPADTGVVLEQGASYHAIKAGLSQIIRYYAVVLGNEGIRVNGIRPAIVLKPRAQDFYNKNADLVRLFNRVIPLGRMGSPKDIANATLFLSSSLASYITGQIISIDGGLSLHEAGSLARLASSIFNDDLRDPRWEPAPGQSN
jgi:NAD(P)-dependent dehydrogenase (short-subunit alcohol dehydrogenase family)